MWRKRATSAPAFRQPAPYNPLSGQHAPIGRSFPYSRIAMMQVAEEDTHDNYVVCRGFDPECGRFLNTVNVAKPYGIRGTNPYVVGQVFAAAKPRTALGDTPGKAETTVGHPADLDEAVMILTDDDGNPIVWLDIGTAEGGKIEWGKVQAGFTNANGTEHRTVSVKACDFDGANVVGDAFDVKTPLKAHAWTDLAENDVVGFVHDEDDNLVIVTDCWLTSLLLWGRVQAGFTNASGAAIRTVSVKQCLYDGSGEAGDAFNVKTPLKANVDTALFTGYVVGYENHAQGDGSILIVTDCWDDPIGTVRMVTAATAIRDGWTEIEGMRNKFPRGWDNDATRKTGGANVHTSADVAAVLADHTVDIAGAVVDAHSTFCILYEPGACTKLLVCSSDHNSHTHTGTVSVHAGVAEAELDNLPEFYTFIFIERTT